MEGIANACLPLFQRFSIRARTQYRGAEHKGNCASNLHSGSHNQISCSGCVPGRVDAWHKTIPYRFFSAATALDQEAKQTF
jgi:hypothetical protein